MKNNKFSRHVLLLGVGFGRFPFRHSRQKETKTQKRIIFPKKSFHVSPRVV